jgi:hypothetical protein
MITFLLHGDKTQVLVAGHAEIRNSANFQTGETYNNKKMFL